MPLDLFLTAHGAQLQLGRTLNHQFQDMIDRVTMDAGSFGYELLKFRADAAQETGRCFARAIPWLVRKNSP
jgi:hypothetical protein